MASYLTCMALIEDRRCGIWDRTMAAGATPRQFAISHLITGGAMMTLQAVEFICYGFYVSNNNDSWTKILLVAALIIGTGLAGVLYGLCISIGTDSSLVATYFSILIAFPLICLSGEIKNLFLI